MISIGCEQVARMKETASEKITKNNLRDEIEKIYQKVKKSGEQVPDNAMEWAIQDIKKLGDLEYKVLEVKTSKIIEIENILNSIGKNRFHNIVFQKTCAQLFKKYTFERSTEINTRRTNSITSI
jgi:hypothetical protein